MKFSNFPHPRLADNSGNLGYLLIVNVITQAKKWVERVPPLAFFPLFPIPCSLFPLAIT
jgi:hypothetical protein